LGTIETKREIRVNPYREAKEWLDALTVVCQPIWIRQMLKLKLEHLRRLKLDSSGRWLGTFEEREAKRNEQRTRTS